MENNYRDKRQMRKNILFNILILGVNGAVGLILPPFLIRHLGVDVYGVIPIATSITSFMLLFTISINGTLSRFFSVDMHVGEQQVSQTFNTAFFSLLALVVVLFPGAIVFSFYMDKVLNIPPQVVHDSHLLFLLVFLSFFFHTFGSLFNSVAYVKNRIDLRNTALLIDKVAMLVILIVVFMFGYIHIQVYGIALFFSTLIACFYSYSVFRKLVPFLKITPKDFRTAAFFRMSKLGFWLIVNQIGVLLLLQTEVLVVNSIKGPILSGIYAALIQWSFLIRALTGVLSGVTGPVILHFFAVKDWVSLKDVTAFSMKLIGVFTSCIVAALIYFAPDILRLWLGEDFVPYTPVFIALVFHLGLNLACNPVVNLNIAFNKAVVPGIVTLVTGAFNVIVSILLLKYTALGILGVALSGCLFLTLKNFVFTPYYAAKIMGLSYWTYYKPILPSVILTLAALCGAAFFPGSLPESGHNLMVLIAYTLLFIIFVGIISYFVFFNRSERKRLVSLLIRK